MARTKWNRASKKVQSQNKNVKRTPIMRRNAYSPYSSIRGTNPENSVSFKGKGFPDRLTTNLVYSDTIILDPSAGTPCPLKTYVMTSPYDPDNALGGSQPTYWDQLAAVYGRYRVNGSKITAIFSRSTTVLGNVGPYICGISCSDATSLPSTNPMTLMSAPNTGFRVVNQEDGSVAVSATYSQKNTYPDFESAVQARTNANPTLNWFAKVFASPQGVNVEEPINVVIIIEFNVTFSDVTQIVDA